MEAKNMEAKKYLVVFAIGVTSTFNTYAQALGAKYHHAVITGKSLDAIYVIEIEPESIAMAA